MSYPLKATAPLRLLAIGAATMALTATAFAVDRHVPSVYPTIQQAINASSSGDQILLQSGIFYENINFNGKNVVIKPFNDNFQSIIDGNQAGPVVTFSGAESANAGLRKLTIRNGKTSNGGGIKGNNTLATIKNCVIGGNTATGNGGGIYGVSGLIQTCTITQNTAANGGGISDCDGVIDSCKITLNEATVAGGGIFDSPGQIQFCEITKNEAKNGGGGVSGSDGLIIGNLISANKVTATGPIASPNGFGGGLNDMGGTVTMNMILGNQSGGDGGGMSSSSATVTNNIIAENSARRGAGLASCTGVVANNTIWDNVASHQGGGCYGMGTLVANCIIYQNSAPADMQWAGANVPTYSCVQGWAGGQPDIITGAPLLADPTKGNFDLLPGSPCIDAGKLVLHIPTDYEGDVRPFDGTPTPAGDGSDFDIGADEFSPGNIDLSGALTNVVTKSKGVVPKLKYSIKGQLPVANTGTDITETVALVQFYLSNDAVYDPGDTLVGKTVQIKKLKGGKTKMVKANIKLPINTTATGLYLISVIDTTNTVAESNEGNNESSFGPLP